MQRKGKRKFVCNTSDAVAAMLIKAVEDGTISFEDIVKETNLEELLEGLYELLRNEGENSDAQEFHSV